MKKVFVLLVIVILVACSSPEMNLLDEQEMEQAIAGTLTARPPQSTETEGEMAVTMTPVQTQNASNQATKDAMMTNTPQPTSTPAEEPSQSGEVSVDEWDGIFIGMCADDVLKIHPKSETIQEPEVLGTDSQGIVVKWIYSSAYLILARREGQDGITCYRVQEIYLIR